METPWNEYSLMHMTAGVCVYMYQERAIMTPSPATEIFPLRLWLRPLNTVPLFLTFHFFFFILTEWRTFYYNYYMLATLELLSVKSLEAFYIFLFFVPFHFYHFIGD